MEKKKLLELAKQLNKLEDEEGNLLVSKKVKVVAVNEETLISSFLESCNSIDESKEELLPEEITEAYNELVENKNEKEGEKLYKDETLGCNDNKKDDKSQKKEKSEKKVDKKSKILKETKVQSDYNKKKKNGIGAFVYEQLRKNPGFDNRDLCQIVLDKFPNANTKPSCIAWYKNKLRKSVKK